MKQKMKQLVLVVAMLAVMVTGVAPQVAFAQPGGAAEEEIEPAKGTLDGGDAAKPEEEAAPGDEAEPKDDGQGPGIIAGTDVKDGTFPFMAQLLLKGPKHFPYDELTCGGTLIDEDSV